MVPVAEDGSHRAVDRYVALMVTIRRAEAGDLDWLAALYGDGDVEPFLGGGRAKDRAALAAEVERSLREPQRFGRLVVEEDGERAGAMGYHEVSDAHRIAQLEVLAVHPDFRRRGVADEAAHLLQRYLLLELGYHRLELACYGFNEAVIRHAERVGFVREGVKRKAYLRHGAWQDAVQFALLREDLDAQASARRP
jgi:RimJ/RimL family protein N-acetyltransferase